MICFGVEWKNQDDLKRACSSILDMSETEAWRAFSKLAQSLILMQKDKFLSAENIEAVKENAGIIRGMEKLLALPSQCSSVLKQDEIRKEY
jgi:hypothetical protein